MCSRRHPTKEAVQNLTHMQNYFGPLIAQTWSLAVEEHFYLFPLVLLILFARLRLRANAILGILFAICALVLVAAHGGRLERRPAGNVL